MCLSRLKNALIRLKLRHVLIGLGIIVLFYGASLQMQVTPKAVLKWGPIEITGIDPAVAVFLYIGTLWFLTGISLHVKGK